MVMTESIHVWPKLSFKGEKVITLCPWVPPTSQLTRSKKGTTLHRHVSGPVTDDPKPCRRGFSALGKTENAVIGR